MEIINLLIKAAIILVIIFLTTFGWRPVSKYKVVLSGDESASLERLRRIVTFLSEDLGIRNYIHYQNLQEAANFIQRSFEEIGYSVESNPYEINGVTFKNIIAQMPGNKPASGILLIGAHYDSCYNPGADDNASGIAALIELARLLKDVPLTHTLRFAAFVNEEPPFFLTDQMGSSVYVKQLQSKGEPLRAAVILEMLGFYSEKLFSQKYLPLLGPFYPNRANFITIVGNFPSRKIVKDLYQGFKAGSTFPVEKIVAPSSIPGIYYSDHWSFWKAGYPAVMITDTAYLRSPHYHSKTDLPDTIDYPRLAKVIFGFKEAIMRLDQQLSNTNGL